MYFAPIRVLMEFFHTADDGQTFLLYLGVTPFYLSQCPAFHKQLEPSSDVKQFLTQSLMSHTEVSVVYLAYNI